MNTPRFTPALTAAAALVLASCNCGDTPLPKEVEDGVEDVRGEVEKAVDPETQSAESEFEALIASLPEEKKNDPELVQVLRDLAGAGIDIDGDDNGLYSIAGKIDRSNMHLKDKLVILKQLGIRIDGELLQALATGVGVSNSGGSSLAEMAVWIGFSAALTIDTKTDPEAIVDELFQFADILATDLAKEFRKSGLNDEANIIELAALALNELLVASDDPYITDLPEGTDKATKESLFASRLRYGKTKSAALYDSIEILCRHATLTVQVLLSHTDQVVGLLEKILGKEEAEEFKNMLNQNPDLLQMAAQQFERQFFNPEQVTSPEYLAVLSQLKAAGMKLDGPVKMDDSSLGDGDYFRHGAIIYSLPYELAMNKDFVEGLLRMHRGGIKITMGATLESEEMAGFYGDDLRESFDEDNVLLALTSDNKGADSAYIDLMLAYHNAGGVVDEAFIDNISLEEAHDPEFGRNLVDSVKNGVDTAFLDRKDMRNRRFLEALKALSQERGEARLSRKFIRDVNPELVINPGSRATLLEWMDVECIDDVVGALTPEKVASDSYRSNVVGMLCDGHGAILSPEDLTLEAGNDTGYLAIVRSEYDCGSRHCSYGSFPTYAEYKAGLEEGTPEEDKDDDIPDDDDKDEDVEKEGKSEGEESAVDRLRRMREERERRQKGIPDDDDKGDGIPDDDDDTTGITTPSEKDGKIKRDRLPAHEGPEPKDDIDKGRG